MLGEYNTITISGIVFTGIGFLLLVFRIVRMIMLAHNRSPIHIDLPKDTLHLWVESIPSYMTTYWFVTFFVSGPFIVLAAIYSPLDCDNGCDRSGKGTQIYSVFIGILLSAISFSIMQCIRSRTKTIIDETAYSGVDITLLLIGAGMLFTDLALGGCPDTACVKKS